jgi:sRNA-binding protein
VSNDDAPVESLPRRNSDPIWLQDYFLQTGHERVDLDGNPAGVVTAEVAALALALLAARGDKEKRRQDEKERQGSKQKPARTPPQPKRITLADPRKAAEKRRPPP